MRLRRARGQRSFTRTETPSCRSWSEGESQVWVGVSERWARGIAEASSAWAPIRHVIGSLTRSSGASRPASGRALERCWLAVSAPSR